MNDQKRTTGLDIASVHYSPKSPYRLDMEILRASDLKRRASAEHLTAPQRIDFHLIIAVSKGSLIHSVDFEPVVCKPHSVLMIRPGQVHSWDVRCSWNGWIVIMRPEFLQPHVAIRTILTNRKYSDLNILPSLLQLEDRDYEATVEAICRMRSDAGTIWEKEGLQILLRTELEALITRLSLHFRFHQRSSVPSGSAGRRFERFRVAVDRNFSRIHSVAAYAAIIGCTEKSLQRAALVCTNHSAKALITQRIVLEAKRLLVHGDTPASQISGHLGFSEATNFVKFFRRNAGMTPRQFRQKHIADHVKTKLQSTTV